MATNNHHGLKQETKPGSAGLAMPRFDVAVLDDALRPVAPGTSGVLAVHCATSLMFTFTGYWRADTPQLTDEWYVTGDTMSQDADGHFFFAGRDDDIITSSGYRIGPFDVESVMIEHPAIAEVAIVGKPDPERTEILKAFVVLRKWHAAGAALTAELQQHVRERLSQHAYPREVEFVDELLSLASWSSCPRGNRWILGRLSIGDANSDRQR